MEAFGQQQLTPKFSNANQNQTRGFSAIQKSREKSKTPQKRYVDMRTKLKNGVTPLKKGADEWENKLSKVNTRFNQHDRDFSVFLSQIKGDIEKQITRLHNQHDSKTKPRWSPFSQRVSTTSTDSNGNLWEDNNKLKKQLHRYVVLLAAIVKLNFRCKEQVQVMKGAIKQKDECLNRFYNVIGEKHPLVD
jgi:hypothetical protein